MLPPPPPPTTGRLGHQSHCHLAPPPLLPMLVTCGSPPGSTPPPSPPADAADAAPLSLSSPTFLSPSATAGVSYAALPLSPPKPPTRAETQGVVTPPWSDPSYSQHPPPPTPPPPAPASASAHAAATIRRSSPPLSPLSPLSPRSSSLPILAWSAVVLAAKASCLRNRPSPSRRSLSPALPPSVSATSRRVQPPFRAAAAAARRRRRCRSPLPPLSLPPWSPPAPR